MRIAELMTDSIRVCAPKDDVRTIANVMRDANVGAVPVIEGEQIRGIVTDRDLALRAVADGRDPTSLTAADVMTDNPVTIRRDASTEDAAGLMKEKKVRRLVVTDDDGAPCGIVSLGDLAVRDHKAHGDVLEEVCAAP